MDGHQKRGCTPIYTRKYTPVKTFGFFYTKHKKTKTKMIIEITTLLAHGQKPLGQCLIHACLSMVVSGLWFVVTSWWCVVRGWWSVVRGL